MTFSTPFRLMAANTPVLVGTAEDDEQPAPIHSTAGPDLVLPTIPGTSIPEYLSASAGMTGPAN